MSITSEAIEQVARLARLELTGNEQRLFTEQMGAILDYVAALDELNTADVQPTSHAVPMQNAFRPDEVLSSIGHDRALANAPDTNETYFRVPPVIE